MEIFLLILFGFLAGIIGGMGMGGGTILIPLLTIFLSISQKSAQGLNLICFLFLAIPALIIHFKNKMISTKYLWIVILSGVLFCVLGSFLATLLDSKILKICFGIFLIGLSILEFVKTFKKEKQDQTNSWHHFLHVQSDLQPFFKTQALTWILFF